jgi:hypothetical protein
VYNLQEIESFRSSQTNDNSDAPEDRRGLPEKDNVPEFARQEKMIARALLRRPRSLA